MMTRYFGLIAGVALTMTSPAAAEQISIADLAGLPESDVVFLGEIHDNPTHHLTQAAAISALKPTALVFEMFTESVALNLRPEDFENAETLQTALKWEERGWPDFAIYYPIFASAGDSVIYGGGTDRDDVRRAVSEGAAGVFGGGAEIFGVTEKLDDDEQVEREAMQMAAHCDALPEEMLGGMVEAQRFRDVVLARAVVAAHLETGGPVAVITGNGHARKDWGVPGMLEIADPELRVLSIGQFEAVPQDEAVPFDLWLISEPTPRDDPCAAFKD